MLRARKSGDGSSWDTAKTQIRGRAVWSVLAPCSTSVSVAVRLKEEERKRDHLLPKDSNRKPRPLHHSTKTVLVIFTPATRWFRLFKWNSLSSTLCNIWQNLPVWIQTANSLLVFHDLPVYNNLKWVLSVPVVQFLSQRGKISPAGCKNIPLRRILQFGKVKLLRNN